jgi:hypothetical protein
VRYFDECIGLDPKVRLMLNERILEVENQARLMVMQNAEHYRDMQLKLERYEKLPVNRKVFAAFSIEEIFEALSILETDPYIIW